MCRQRPIGGGPVPHHDTQVVGPGRDGVGGGPVRLAGHLGRGLGRRGHGGQDGAATGQQAVGGGVGGVLVGPDQPGPVTHGPGRPEMASKVKDLVQPTTTASAGPSSTSRDPTAIQGLADAVVGQDSRAEDPAGTIVGRHIGRGEQVGVGGGDPAVGQAGVQLGPGGGRVVGGEQGANPGPAQGRHGLVHPGDGLTGQPDHTIEIDDPGARQAAVATWAEATAGPIGRELVPIDAAIMAADDRPVQQGDSGYRSPTVT